MSGAKSYDIKAYQCKQSLMEMTSHLLEGQDKMTNTSQRVQQQSSIDSYINALKSCTGDRSDEFNHRVLSARKLSKVTGNDHKGICLPKPKETLTFYIPYY